MWNDFNDYELACLAGDYGLEDELTFDSNLHLVNRSRVEQLLTDLEMSMILSALDNNQQYLYN